jgi:23S rRNA pseudouridine955/2504/2580 synthase
VKHIFTAKKGYERLSALVTERLGFLPLKVIKKQISLGEAKINGARVLIDAPLKAGDELKFFLPESMEAGEPEIEFLYADGNIAVAVKPVLCETETHLTAAVKKTYPSAAAVHRLDRNTKGLVMFALKPGIEEELKRLIALKAVKKYYRARVCGRIRPEEKTVKVFLKKNAAKGFTEVSDLPRKGFKTAELYYRETGTADGDSILDVLLFTGRTHQIRATFAHLGHPVAGDGKYGNEKENRKRGLSFQDLTAYKIRFDLSGETACPLAYLDNYEISMNL